MKIKELREYTKLSQKAFGKKFKIPYRSIQNWEGGQSEPPPYIPEMIQRLIILEEDLEAMKAGQLTFATAPEQDPQQQQPKKEENSTNMVQEPQQLTTDQEIIQDVWKYLNEDADLECADCKYNKGNCDNEECIIQTYKHYDRLCELLKKASE